MLRPTLASAHRAASLTASIALVTAAFAALASCTGGSNAQDAGTDADSYAYHTPTVPDGGILLETNPFTVQPGGEVLMCSFTPVHATGDVDTRELHSFQMPGGHHVILMYTTREYPTDTHPCTEEEMNDLRIVGGGDSSHEQALHLPDGLGIRIPAGAQLALQSHYLNLDTVAHTVKDALVVVRAAPGVVTTIADAFAISDGDMMIPPHAAYGRTVECTFDQTMNLVTLLGHTHQYGTHIRLDLYRQGSTTPETVYDQAAGERLRSNPPINYYDSTNPLTFHAGDRLRLSCDWMNTTDYTLAYPQEMCVGFGYYYPGNGWVSCGTLVETRGGSDAGVMSTNGNAGCDTPWTPDQPCVRTCNTGNEIGVGRYCTAGGNQCRGNHSAIICTADVDPTAPGFCTKPCSSNEGCGSGAVCTGDSRGMGCTPVECVTPDDAGTDASTDDAAADASMDAAMSSMDAGD